MTKTTDEQLLRLWRASYPLSNAWLAFASAEDQAKWRELRETSAIKAYEAGAKAVSESDADPAVKFMHLLSGPSKIFEERKTHQEKLQQGVLKLIESGHLHGFGFEPPRTLDAVPAAIPKRAWFGRINWEKNTLTFESIELIEVRLITNRIRNEILERSHVDNTPARAPGRPGIKRAVEDAFETLHKAGQIDTGRSMKSHFPAVRHWLDINRPDLSTSAAMLTDEGIRAHFSPRFKELEKSRKQ